MAFAWGRHNHLARAYQLIPVGITVEGANILTRTMIIFGQGAMRSHPFLLKEVEAVHNQILSKVLKISIKLFSVTWVLLSAMWYVHSGLVFLLQNLKITRRWQYPSLLSATH